LEHDLFRKPVPTFRDHGLTNTLLLRLLPRHPGGKDLPVRVVLRGELPAAGVIGVAARLRRERLERQSALRWIAQYDQSEARFRTVLVSALNQATLRLTALLGHRWSIQTMEQVENIFGKPRPKSPRT
jgi:hypothetical protein